MKPKHIAYLLIGTFLTSAFVWVRLQIVNISYAINETSQEDRRLREECNNLNLRINEAKSPQKLERLAKIKFQMNSPTPGQVVILTE